jgi:hypothetical protein
MERTFSTLMSRLWRYLILSCIYMYIYMYAYENIDVYIFIDSCRYGNIRTYTCLQICICVYDLFYIDEPVMEVF